MTGRLIRLIIASCSLHWVSSARANPYDECILHHMGGAQTKEAVYAVERSCINTTTVNLPNDETEKLAASSQAVPGSFNDGYLSINRKRQLLIRITNVTTFDLTGVLLAVFDRSAKKLHTYSVTSFDGPLPEGAFTTGIGEPALNVIKAGAQTSFLVDVDDLNVNMANFSKIFNWSIVAAKGIPSK